MPGKKSESEIKKLVDAQARISKQASGRRQW
jgi:hypothetical protein